MVSISRSLFGHFPTIPDYFKISEDYRRLTEISEDYRRLPKTDEDVHGLPKMSEDWLVYHGVCLAIFQQFPIISRFPKTTED